METKDQEEFNAMYKIANSLVYQLQETQLKQVDFDCFLKLLHNSWVDIDLDTAKKVYTKVPHKTDRLLIWCKKFSNKKIQSAMLVPYLKSALESYPMFLTRLREVASNYGKNTLLVALQSKVLLYRQDLLDLAQKLGGNLEEVEEFRKWSAENGLTKKQGVSIAVESSKLMKYLEDIEFSPPESSNSSPQKVIQNFLSSVVSDKLLQTKRNLLMHSRNEFVDELRFREVLNWSMPSLSYSEVTSIINSLSYKLPPDSSVPFTQIYIPEFISLFSKKSFTINIEQKQPQPSTHPQEPEEPVVEEFILPKDRVWELQVLKKLNYRSKELLANFRIADSEKCGSLTLEQFHWVVFTSCPWLSKAEVFYLCDLAVREAGVVDEKATLKVKENLTEYTERAKTISRALFPDGRQFRVSYLYFLVVVEKICLESS